MRRILPIIVSAFLLFAVSAVRGEDGFVDLIDGKSLDGWTTAEGKPVTQGWEVQDGMLVRASRGGAIYAPGEYGDFELRFEWKISPRGNSGIKYRVAHYKVGVRGRPGWLGAEYQIFDDVGRKATAATSAGALYGLYAPNEKKSLKPVGEFNESRIVVRGSKVEHWLNGEKIVDADLASDDWKARVANSKFNRTDGFLQNATGRIQVQDHGAKVWFRKLQVRELK